MAQKQFVDPLTEAAEISVETQNRYFDPKNPQAAKNAMELHKLHPDAYRAIRDAYQKRGRIGPTSYASEAEKNAMQAVRRGPVVSNADLDLQEKHPREFCKKLLQGGRTEDGKLYAQLKKDDPVRFQEIRAACLAWELVSNEKLANDAKPRAPKQEISDPGFVTIPADLAERLGQKVGTRMTVADFGLLMARVTRQEASELHDKQQLALQAADEARKASEAADARARAFAAKAKQ
jgi:bifunctional DNA-binding transcriptional regulator/antitoxin component of YhaV-PrlF toxin-antitoxin module